MISKFLQNLSEDKKNKLVTILNHNRSSTNPDIQENRITNLDEYLSLQKSLGILDLSNQNIKIIEDQVKHISKSKGGNHSVHFTPKPPVPNTILGLFEDKIEIASFGGGVQNDKKPGKGDHHLVLEKLRRTLVPLFSGGLALNRIAELN